jgi:hypothetical protein
MKMAAHHLQNETLQVTDIDVQDFATVIGQDTESIFVETNNDNNINGSVQIQDMLADVLSTLNSIQSQNTKANEELGAKQMAENQKLTDRLTEQLQHEITKVTEYGLVINFKTNCLMYEIERNMKECKFTNKVEAELEPHERTGHGFQETANHDITQTIHDESVWTMRKYVAFVNSNQEL